MRSVPGRSGLSLSRDDYQKQTLDRYIAEELVPDEYARMFEAKRKDIRKVC